MTEHTVRIGDQTISYKATASTTIVERRKGRADRADVFDGVHA